jgi:predicted secreted protein
MTALTGDELVFDLQIFNNDGQIYETVTGIRMRDVSKAMKKQAVE